MVKTADWTRFPATRAFPTQWHRPDRQENQPAGVSSDTFTDTAARGIHAQTSKQRNNILPKESLLAYNFTEETGIADN